jgi:hypothetical protein
MNLSTSNFSKFLIKLIFIVSVISFILTKIFEQNIILKTQTSGAYKINKIINEDLENEIPIFGTSRAKSNYFSSIINKNCFNYGVDGISSKIWIFFLEEELKKNKQKPIIINFDLNGFRNYLGSNSNYIFNYPSIKNLTNQHSFNNNLPLLKYYGYYEYYLTEYLKYKFPLNKIIDKGGVYSNSIFSDSDFNFNIIRRSKLSEFFKIDSNQVKKLFSLINATNRKIYFVISPYHKSVLNNYSNLKDAFQFLRLLEKCENVKVLNYSEVELKDEMFFNTSHLNYNGSQLFSKLLLDSLKLIDSENFN